MTSADDSGATTPGRRDQEHDRDLWSLPVLREAAAQRVRYRTPRRHASAGGVVERAEAVEIEIRTDGEIPIRALSPALFVGGVELTENEQLDATSYRFFVDGELTPGDPIVLGWVGQPPPSDDSPIRYTPPVDVVER